MIPWKSPSFKSIVNDVVMYPVETSYFNKLEKNQYNKKLVMFWVIMSDWVNYMSEKYYVMSE